MSPLKTLFLLALLGAFIIPLMATSQPCIRECPADCGATRRADGCLNCNCQGNFNGRQPNNGACPPKECNVPCNMENIPGEKCPICVCPL